MSGELDFGSVCTRSFACIYRNNFIQKSIPKLPLSKDHEDLHRLCNFNTDIERIAHCDDNFLCRDIDEYQIYVPSKVSCFNCKGVQELDFGENQICYCMFCRHEFTVGCPTTSKQMVYGGKTKGPGGKGTSGSPLS